MALVDWKKEQVYALMWQGEETKGIAGIFKSRESALNKYHEYRKNKDKLREFLGMHKYDFLTVADDPDDAIEVWDVQE